MKHLNNLEKQYHHLNPSERLELIIAASARGDRNELDWLVDSAPDLSYRIPHHFGLGEALTRIALAHRLGQLERAGSFWMATSRLDSPGAYDAFLLLARSYRAHAAGWDEFCASLNLDPSAALGPAAEPSPLLEATDLAVAGLAPLLDAGPPPEGFPTASSIAAEYRRLYDSIVSFWLVPRSRRRSPAAG